VRPGRFVDWMHQERQMMIDDLMIAEDGSPDYKG
jgi:hypothetical protein